jgi:Uma2 family endonuclease
MTTPTQTEMLLTGEDLLALGDIGPCELVEGRLVKMSPTRLLHGKYEVRLSTALHIFATARQLGVVVAGEVGLYVRRNPDTIRAADIIFISSERYQRLSQPEGFLDVAPDLVVEILSPNDYWVELNRKLREYFAAGVRLVPC